MRNVHKLTLDLNLSSASAANKLINSFHNKELIDVLGLKVSLCGFQQDVDFSSIERCTTITAEGYEALELEAPKQQKPKRTKVEYVKCEFNHAWEALKAFEDGEVLYRDKNQTLDIKNRVFVVAASVGGIGYILTYYKADNLYRRIETEIDERQEFIATAFDLDGVKPHPISVELVGKMFDSGKFKLVD